MIAVFTQRERSVIVFCNHMAPSLALFPRSNIRRNRELTPAFDQVPESTGG